jgi:putative peptidoglycan lipid II flippase
VTEAPEALDQRRVAAAGESATVVRRAGVVAAFTLASRFTGYARDALLANLFGASAVFDAFVIAQTIPNLLRRLVAEGALVIAYVPMLSEQKTKGGIDAMRRFTAAVLGLLIPVLLFFVAIGVFFPEAVVGVFAPGFEKGRGDLAVSLTRIMMPYVFFISLMALAGGALNVQGRFAAPAAAPIVLNAATISFALILGPRFAEPIEAVAWSITVGGILQLALQIPFLAKEKLLVGVRWAPKDEPVVTLMRRMGPAIFGVAVYQINIMVIRQIGSFLPEGQLSCYYNATRLQEFALGVFAVSVSVAALPTLSEHAARHDWTALAATFRRALRVTNFVTVPAMIELLALSGPIVGVLFRHGHFTEQNADMTAKLLVLLALALVPIGAVRVAVPTFYALGDTRTPVLGATASLLATFAIGFATRTELEIYGLTLATSAAAMVQLVVLWAMLRKAIAKRRAADRELGIVPPQAPQAAPAAKESGVVGHAIRCAIAAAPGIALAYVLAGLRNWYQGGNLVGAAFLLPLIGLTIVLYFVLAKLLGIPEVDLVLGGLKRRLLRRRR